MAIVRSQLFRALRACFRAVPLSEPTRDALRARFLQQFPSVRPLPAQGQPGDARERRPRVHSGGRAIGYVEYSEEPLPDPLPATLVAFYLPQFHTIPENDAWWGKGFTEWRNVARALPQFEGHVQPRLPGDLGFYDLRNPQVMRDQAKLAKTYGLSAFCFYFYWFGGKTLLEEPLRNWLADKSIDFQYCLCWANENWSRRWDGRDDEILIAQQHSPEDDIAFITHVAEYLRDPRYLRVDGKPLLLLYRPGLLPDARATAERWRTWCRDNGIGEIQLAYVQSFERPAPAAIGFDAAVEFPPNLCKSTEISAAQRLLNLAYRGQVLDWRTTASDVANRAGSPGLYPGVNCGWDNQARRPAAGRTFLHATPHAFRNWLAQTIRNRLPVAPADARLVFVNAWNEWAEAAVLEPSAALGHAWLHAMRAALRGALPALALPVMRPCAIVHAWYPDVLGEILARLKHTGLEWRLLITTTPDREHAVHTMVQRADMQAEIHVGENRGRDILPFLHAASRLALEGESLVLKLHTKRSPHRPDGDAWRQSLVNQLTDPRLCADIRRRFESTPRLGMIVPDGHLLALDYYWGANADTVRALAVRTGITESIDPATDTFPSGSMFWARLDALMPLLDAQLGPWDFDDEAGQVDGTFAHAVERAFGLVVRSSGYDIAQASGETPEPQDGPYAFAPRS